LIVINKANDVRGTIDARSAYDSKANDFYIKEKYLLI